MMLTLEDIERRAKARGWVVDRHGTKRARVYSGDDFVASLAVDEDGAWYCDDYEHHQAADYLETGYGTEARERAARVLSCVAQVAALMQGQRLAWVAVQGALAGAPVPCADCGGLGFKEDRIDLTCARCGGTGRKGVAP